MSRELDALVAEKVMGQAPDVARNPDGSWRRSWLDAYRAEDTLYSTDLAAAWRVVEKMRESCRVAHDDWFELYCNSDGQWTAVLRDRWGASPEEEPGTRSQGNGASAPEAICRAALKAVGHD